MASHSGQHCAAHPRTTEHFGCTSRHQFLTTKSLPRMRNCNPPRKTELAYPELRLTEAFRGKSIPHLFIPSLWRGMNTKAIPRPTTRHTRHYFCVARSGRGLPCPANRRHFCTWRLRTVLYPPSSNVSLRRPYLFRYPAVTIYSVTNSEFKAAFEEHKDAVYRFAWRMTNPPPHFVDID